MPVAKTNGIKLAFEQYGEGQPLLFVHGFPLSGRLWEHVIEPFTGAYKLIIPDLRGMGSSQASESASMATYADNLA